MVSFAQWLSDYANSAKNFFDSIYGFIFEGGLTAWAAELIAYFFEVWVKFQLFMTKAALQAAVIVIQDLANELNLAGDIEGYWMAIDVEYRNLMVFFNVPLILAMFIGAYITRKVLKFSGVL